jgi:uncharacterized protein YukE
MSSGGGQYTHGMNVAKVEDIIGRLLKAKNDLVEAQGKADGAVKKLGPQNWGGPDAQAFRSQWTKQAAALDHSIQSLQTMVKAARADVSDQQQASS